MMKITKRKQETFVDVLFADSWGSIAAGGVVLLVLAALLQVVGVDVAGWLDSKGTDMSEFETQIDRDRAAAEGDGGFYVIIGGIAGVCVVLAAWRFLQTKAMLKRAVVTLAEVTGTGALRTKDMRAIGSLDAKFEYTVGRKRVKQKATVDKTLVERGVFAVVADPKAPKRYRMADALGLTVDVEAEPEVTQLPYRRG